MGRRLFLAVNPEPALVAPLAALIAKLGPIPGVRWVAPESIHVTMVFLGDTPPERVEILLAAAREAAAAEAPFVMQVTGLGVFPGRRAPRIVWAGVGEGSEPLSRLASGLADAAARTGWPREARAFRAHLTLGRVRDRLGGAARRQLDEALAASAEVGPSRVTGVSLMESHLGGGPPRYELLATLPLEGPR